MEKIKVLMLGWSNVAYFNGGLGVACEGMCRALARHCDLTLILPRSEPGIDPGDIHTLDAGIELETGWEHRQAGKAPDESPAGVQHGYSEFAEVLEIPVHLDPYFYERNVRPYEKKRTTLEETVLADKETESFPPNYQRDIFGEEVLEKVIEFARRAQELARGLNFDLIHAHDWMTFLAGIYIKNECGKPLVLHVHSLDYDRAGPALRSWVFNVERYCMSKADVVIAVSEYTAGIIHSRYGLSSRHVAVVYNGIDAVERQRTAPASGRKTVLFVGRIVGQKGPLYFLEIAAAVFRKYRDVQFVMVGNGGELDMIYASPVFQSMQEHFELTGFIDRHQLNDYYARADVYCMPSTSEPFGLTALEAAQYGIPVVLSTKAGVGEVLEGALKADFWDIEKMSDHIVSLLRDKALCRRRVAANSESLKKLTWENTAGKILDQYRRLLGSGA
jgi:glycogen synthase